MSDRMGEEIARNAETLAAVQAAYERYAETLVAEWWCALCPTSHPTRAALDKHTAAGHPTSMIGTSARLRQLQQDLAASQANLTRALRERDQFRDNYLRNAARVDQLDSDLVDMELDLGDARAQVVSARVELEQLREYAAISARVIRERNADRRAVWQALGIDTLAPVPDAPETIRDLISELEQLRARINELESREP